MNSVITEAYVALGSNLGNSLTEIKTAVRLLSDLENCRFLAVSSIYETEPEGGVDQPKFLNAVVKISTFLSPFTLLSALLGIEKQRGRVRSGVNQARVIDLDLLLYGDVIISRNDLIVPHPRIHKRAFVLVPLIEIDASVIIHGYGLATDLLGKVSKSGIKKLNAK